MFVYERMTKNPITVTPDTGVDEAIALLKKHRVRRLPVVNNGRLFGFVEDTDLQKACPSSATLLSRYEINTLLSKIKVNEVMPRTLISINQNATIEEAALLFEQSRRGGLPVVDDTGAVVGVITETDVFACFVEIMGLTKGTTRLTARVENRPGTIAAIAGYFAEHDVNIESLVTVPKPDNKLELIIRGDFSADEARNFLTNHGIEVTHTVRIGKR